MENAQKKTAAVRRRIERAIDAGFTAAAIIILIIAACFAGYMLGKIARGRTIETPEEPVHDHIVETPAEPTKDNVLAKIAATMPSAPACLTEPALSPAPDSPLWQDCNVPAFIFTDTDINALARMVYGEARGCSLEGQAGAVWCVLNRVDSDDPYWPDTVLGVITQPGQFFGYKESNPVLPELVELVEDVLMRYNLEHAGIDSGRVLPKEYLFFSGDGVAQNYFTVTYASTEIWDWSLPSPYRDDW